MNDFYIDSNIVVAANNKTFSLKFPFLIIVALTGCICMFSVCFSMVYPEYNKTVFWAVTVFNVLLTCILNNLPGKLQLTGTIPIILALLTAFFKQDSVVKGAKLLYNYYYCAVHNTDTLFFKLEHALTDVSDLTLFLCCASVILCSLISRYLIHKTYFIVYFLLTFIPVEFGLYEGLNMNMPAMLILVATWFCVLSVQLASFISKKGISGSILNSSNTANCGIAALAVTIVSVLLSVAVCNAFELTTDSKIQEKRSEMRSNIESLKWQDISDKISDIGISLGLMDDPDLRELGTKNKLEYRNEDVVQVTFSEMPEQNIYLKNFTGSIYEDNSWSVIPDDEWDKYDKLNTLFNKFECVPQILPFMSNQSIYEDSENASIKIKSLSRSEKILMPYASYGEKCVYINDTGSAFKSNEEYSYSISMMQDFYSIASMPKNYYYLPTSGFNFDDNTTATFFSQLGADADISQESLCVSSIRPPFIENSTYKTQALQASLAESYAYRNFVYEKYASPNTSSSLDEVYDSIPVDIYERANNGNTLDTLAAIRDYLAETSEYSMSPGETPSTRDFINYFLLENNKGYCMHFASAGVMLARYFGIPARYCEGYIISKDMLPDAKKNKDGSVTINIPDSASHAWCEYYIDGYGWVPYELTPGYYDINSPENNGSVENVYSEPIETETATTEEIQTETTINTTTVTETQISNTTATETIISDLESNEKEKNGGSNTAVKIILYILMSAAVIALILFIITTLRRYALMRRKREFNDSNRISAVLSIYKFLMLLLKYLSITPENMQLLDFAEIAAKKLNSAGFEGDTASEIIKAALAADMGGIKPTREEIERYIMYTDSLAYAFVKDKNVISYLILKYVYHFI